ncbi:MAG TPA: 3D domain-containing protein [Phycisphaerales bacterium]|nr:3D domain-containing protein [Phycisphaerales bacterium]
MGFIHAGSAHAARRRRIALEIGAFVALAVMVGSTAALAKRTTGVTPLASVERPPRLVESAFVPAPASSEAFIGESAAVEEPDAQQTAAIDRPEYGPEVRWFNGRPVRPARAVWMTVTAYSPDARSCAPFDDGLTATLHSVETNAMRLVAADTSVFPFGSMLSIPGYDDGQIVPVLDRGSAIKGHRLDVLMPTHKQARSWGVQRLRVVVWEYADGLAPDNPRRLR